MMEKEEIDSIISNAVEEAAYDLKAEGIENVDNETLARAIRFKDSLNSHGSVIDFADAQTSLINLLLVMQCKGA